MLNITNHQGFASQNHSITSYQSDWLLSKRQQISAGERVEVSCTVDGNINWYSHCGKQYGNFSKKLKKIELPYNPAISLWDIYLKKTKILIRKDICTTVFIATLFTIAKIWKQLKCPSIDQWIKKI